MYYRLLNIFKYFLLPSNEGFIKLLLSSISSHKKASHDYPLPLHQNSPKSLLPREIQKFPPYFLLRKVLVNGQFLHIFGRITYILREFNLIGHLMSPHDFQ